MGSVRAGPEVRADSHGLESGRARRVGADVLATVGSRCCPVSRRDPDSVAHWVDWVAKRRLVEGYAERHDIRPGDSPKLQGDRPPVPRPAGRTLLGATGGSRDTRGPRARSPRADRTSRRSRPAPTSGAAVSQKFPDDIVAANWDSLVFDVGRDPLRRVPMMEPLRGTADHVSYLDRPEFETAGELLDRLGAVNTETPGVTPDGRTHPEVRSPPAIARTRSVEDAAPASPESRVTS